MFTSIPATGTLTTLHTQLLLTSWVSGSCLLPSVMYFQTHQVTIHRKRFLHLLCVCVGVFCLFVFFFVLQLSEHFKGKQALLCPCCKRESSMQNATSGGKPQAPGRQVASQTRLLPTINVSVLSRPPEENLFYLLHMSLPTDVCNLLLIKKIQYAQSTSSYLTTQPTPFYKSTSLC